LFRNLAALRTPGEFKLTENNDAVSHDEPYVQPTKEEVI
jgi:hypothetical protein